MARGPARQEHRYGRADKRNVFGMPVHRAVFLGASAIILLLGLRNHLRELAAADR